jgi:ribosomal protein S18 acetylase RimI-like enzyme
MAAARNTRIPFAAVDARPFSTDVAQEVLRLGPLTGDDVGHAAALAVRTLANDSRLAQLGESFLRNLYRAALAQSDSLAAKAVNETGETVGYALASADVHAFRAFVQPRMTLPTARSLLNPRRLYLLPKIIRSLHEPEPQPHVPAELLLLYVEPGHKRRGAGRELLKWLHTAFGARGVPRYRVAVRSHLGDAKAFYQAVGFVFEQELSVLGEPMTYFVREL